MSRRSVVFSLFSCLVALVTFSCTLAKVIPSSPWAGFPSKSVYSRSLGPPPMTGFGTVNVPYMPKSPFFPKFVDPKAMISKKTDMLSNLFGGVGTTPGEDSSKPVAGNFLQYPSTGESSDTVATKLDDISQLYAMPKLKFVLPSTEEKRSTTLAENPESSLKGTKPNDKDETKESSSEEMSSNSVKEYLPGMFGPFAMDPSMFIDKKYSFLDTMFKNLATSTTPASVTSEATAKSTIVPPEFWIPSSMIPGPTEYNKKVSDFLDKLFDTLKTNVTSPTEDDSSSSPGTRVARSVEDVSSIISVKDTIMDMILSQLVTLKDNMIMVLNDTIAYQKSTSTSSAMIPKKPFLPSTWMKPSSDPMVPFQQKMMLLSQMFDTLIEIQKNISSSIQEAIKSEFDDQSNSQSSNSIDVPSTRTNGIFLNGSVLDAVLQSLAQNPMYPAITSKGPANKMARATPSATSFWVAYPEDAHTVSKRHIVASNNQYPMGDEDYLNYPRDKFNPNQSADISQKYDKGDNNVNYDTDGLKEKVEKLKKDIKRMEYFMNVPKERWHHHHRY